jgi:hypothetical protein
MSPFDHLLIEVCAASPGPTATRPHVRPVITEIMHFSTQAAADELNRRGHTTVIGKRWHAMQVLRARHRLGLL